MKRCPSTLLRLALVATLAPACTVGGAIVGPLDVGSSDAGSSDGGEDVVDAPAPVDAVDVAVVDAQPPVDVGADVPLDVSVDAPADVDMDVPVDAGADVPVDAGTDVPVDVPVDVGVDVPVDVGVDVPVDAGVSCPAGSTSFMGHCYQAFTTVPPSTAPFNYWAYAENECRTRFTGGHLVSINSAMENTFVRTLVPTTQGIMIGFSDADRTINSYAWIDGSSAAYTNWNPGQPDNRTVLRFTSSLTEDFGLMLSEGTWFDVPYADGNPYVCKF